MLAVLAGFAASVGLVAMHYWRRGVLVCGIALLAGGFLRLVLPTRRVGVLAVRGRTTDVVSLGTLGAAVVLLAAVVPRF